MGWGSEEERGESKAKPEREGARPSNGASASQRALAFSPPRSGLVLRNERPSALRLREDL